MVSPKLNQSFVFSGSLHCNIANYMHSEYYAYIQVTPCSIALAVYTWNCSVSSLCTEECYLKPNIVVLQLCVLFIHSHMVGDKLLIGRSGGHKSVTLFIHPHKKATRNLSGSLFSSSCRGLIGKWMLQHDGFHTVGAGGDDSDRCSAYFSDALQVAFGVFRQLIKVLHAEGGFCPAG